MAPHIRRAAARDIDTIVRILIASKEASFPDTIDDHDLDVKFWTRRWRGYITSGSRAQQSLGDGWVFLAELDGVPVGYKRFYLKYGAVETRPGSPWAIWHDLGALAAQLPRPSAALMTGLREEPTSWFRGLWHRR